MTTNINKIEELIIQISKINKAKALALLGRIEEREEVQAIAILELELYSLREVHVQNTKIDMTDLLSRFNKACVRTLEGE
jgi:hypothetical protein